MNGLISGRKNSRERELIEMRSAAFDASSIRMDRSRYIASHGSGSLGSWPIDSSSLTKSIDSICSDIVGSVQSLLDRIVFRNSGVSRESQKFKQPYHLP